MPDIKTILDLPFLRPVLEVMNGGGEETRIVGGAVRNFLMKQPIADIDLATTALPQIVQQRATDAGWKVIPTGLDHGTVTIVIEQTPIEVTTLRQDLETDGRHAVVQFGRDFEADAHRRDFTMNALSVDLGGHLYDYCGGVEDIKQRRVRFIGEASQRIREDYLRILRFFRFQAVYGLGEPEREGLLASISGSHGLLGISAERIRVEVLKLLRGHNAADVLTAMADAGILPLVFKGACEFGRWQRLLEKVEPLHSLAALTVRVQEDADRLRDVLRLSNEEHRFLFDYAVLLEKVKSAEKPFDIMAIRQLAADWPVLCLLRVFQATRAEHKLNIEVAAFDLLQAFATGQESIPVFALRGADLIAAGLERGAEIGQLLSLARKHWVEIGCPVGEAIKPELLAYALRAKANGHAAVEMRE